MIGTRVGQAWERMQFARSYTLRLLETIDPAEWFRMPTDGVTHVAWQVGHLAVAEYRLIFERVRGIQTGDAAFFPIEFIALFGRDSFADPEPSRYPAPSVIRSVLDVVHEQAHEALTTISDEVLDQPARTPHVLFQTQGEILAWASAHEMMHAGQIGLLRRLFGQKPIW